MCSHSHIQKQRIRLCVSLSIPVMAPQPVVLAHVTAAIRGATPQQVMVAIMKYKKLRSILACTPSVCTHVNTIHVGISRMEFPSHVLLCADVKLW